MKRTLMGLAVVLSGCGENAPGETASQGAEQNEAELLRQLDRGDGAACANPRVQDAIRYLTVEPQNLYRYSGWTETERAAFEAGFNVYVEGIGLNSIDHTTKLISCTGTYVASYGGDGGSAGIIFDIKPSVDGSGPLFRVQDTRTTWNVLRSAVGAYDRQRIAAKQAARDLVPASRNFDEARRMCQRSSNSPDAVRYANNFMREVPEKPNDWFDARTWECMNLVASEGSRSTTAPTAAAAFSPPDAAGQTADAASNSATDTSPNKQRFSLPVPSRPPTALQR